MMATAQIAAFQLRDAIKGRWAIIYGLAFFLLTDSLFRFSPDPEKVTLSLINITMFVTPLVSSVFGAIYFYNSRDFIELTLTQPVARRSVFSGLYFGLAGALSIAFIAGAIAPFAIHATSVSGYAGMLATLLITGIALTLIFVALSFFIACRTDDRGKGLGLTLLTWLWFALLYDGLLLLGAFVFYKYPLEKPVIALIMLNPIDLARILLVMQLDISALMGYTGAVILNFFGSAQGYLICFTALLLWIAVPAFLALRRFQRVDW